MPVEVDPIVLGDNQFFGVNHMSEEKGRITRERFKDIAEIKKIIYTALDLGVRGVFFSTHPDIDQITDMIRKDPVLKKELSIYVNIPYIVKYISMVNAMGIPNTVKYMLRGKTKIENFLFLAGAIKNVLFMDYMGIANKLIDVEMLPFRGLNVKAVFLHNTLCDLCLGYELIHVIKSFDAHIKKKYGVISAYGTLNLPAFCKLLGKADIDHALIMTAINKKGFFMNPGNREYAEVLMNTKHDILAMATLASGALDPEEAYQYLSEIGVKHIVVGLSSKEHARETFSAINRYISGEKNV